MQHGQQEGGGFAAAGLAGDHQVREFGGFGVGIQGLHGLGDGGHLYRGRLGKTHVGHGLQQLLGEAQLHETVGLRCNGFERAFSARSGSWCIGEVRNYIDFDIVLDIGSGFGQKVAPSLKRVSHVFLTNPLHATLLARCRKLHPSRCEKASFMVNKTSTIKRICSSG